MIWLLIPFAFTGAFISRWHGGGFIQNSPKVLKNFLWALPFSVCAYFATTQWWVSLLVLAWSIVFKATGHGGAMDLGHSPKEPGAGRDPEKLEYLVLWLHGRIPTYWYDLLTLAIIGLFSVAGAAFAVGYTNTLAGIIIALGGLGKPIGYAIGWQLNRAIEDFFSEDLNEATEIGEFLTGFLAYLCLGISAMVIL